MSEDRKLRRGYTREDGMVFWGYDKGCLDGKRWVTSDKFSEMKGMHRAYDRDRRNNPLTKEARRKYARMRRRDPVFCKSRLEYEKNRRKADPLFALAGSVRSRIWHALARGGYKKVSSTADLLGCSFEELKAHLENQFTEGMSWDNFGEWHVDHITPLASADSMDHMVPLFHHTNLQPLWAVDNLSKGAKIL